MRVNLKKTAMLTISDATSFCPVAYIVDEEGEKIMGDSESLKIVGFYFDKTPTVTLHVKDLINRSWVLRHLERHGLNSEELVCVYTSNLRSGVKYCNVICSLVPSLMRLKGFRASL